MPHFVLDCAAQILTIQTEQLLIQQVHAVARASELFDETDIKVRVNPYKTYMVGGKPELFVHIFASIMQGRTVEQRAKLSRAMVEKLVTLLPQVPNIAMNISEFEKATYCNRAML